MAIFWTIVSLAIIGVGIWLRIVRSDQFKAFANDQGPVDYIYFGQKQGGIAISKARREIYMVMGASVIPTPYMKSYPFSEVREWTINDVQAGRMVGVGFHAGMAAIGENARASARAAADSGLFVTVKDIESPEWKINMDRANQKKWFEILNQFINES